MNALVFARTAASATCYEEGVDEYRAILERLGDYHAAHMDLARRLLREGELDARRAPRAARPRARVSVPGSRLQLPRVHREGARRPRRDDGALQSRGESRPAALGADPERQRGARVVSAGRPGQQDPAQLDRAPRLSAPRAHGAAHASRTFAADFAEWGSASAPAAAAEVYIRTPDVEGSRSSLKTRLKVVTS